MQRLRDVLRSHLGRSLRELSEEDRLHAAWPVVCGPALASHAELLHLDALRTLHVRVDNETWLAQFVSRRTALAGELTRVAGVHVGAIHFEAQGATSWPPSIAVPGR